MNFSNPFYSVLPTQSNSWALHKKSCGQTYFLAFWEKKINGKMRTLPNAKWYFHEKMLYIKPKKQSRQKNVKKGTIATITILNKIIYLGINLCRSKNAQKRYLGKRKKCSKMCKKMFKNFFLQLAMKIGTNSSFYPIEHPLTDSPGDNFLKFFIIKFLLVNHSEGVERESEGTPANSYYNFLAIWKKRFQMAQFSILKKGKN